MLFNLVYDFMEDEDQNRHTKTRELVPNLSPSSRQSVTISDVFIAKHFLHVQKPNSIKEEAFITLLRLWLINSIKYLFPQSWRGQSFSSMICGILLYYLDNRTTINPEIHEAVHVGEKAISIFSLCCDQVLVVHFMQS